MILQDKGLWQPRLFVQEFQSVITLTQLLSSTLVILVLLTIITITMLKARWAIENTDYTSWLVGSHSYGLGYSFQ
jgi:hypothetical protein